METTTKETIKKETKDKTKKPKSKVRSILSWVFSILFGGIFIVLLVFQIVGMSTKAGNDGIPNYFGYQILQVISDSMEPEYKVGTAVIVKKVEPYEIEIGDDLTFMWNVPELGGVVPVTHRVKKIVEPTQTDSNWYFTTSGINKESDMQNSGNAHDTTKQEQTFTQNEVKGKVIGQSYFLGQCFTFMTGWYGFLIILLIPTLYLIISSVIDIVKALNSDDEDEDKDKLDPPSGGSGNDNTLAFLEMLSKEDKERLKQQLLDELMNESK